MGDRIPKGESNFKEKEKGDGVASSEKKGEGRRFRVA